MRQNMRTKIEQESSPSLDQTAVAAQEEVHWARGQARHATWAVLLPFLLAVLLGIGHRLYGAEKAVDDLRDIAIRTDPDAGPGESISDLAHRLAKEVYGEGHDEEIAARYENLIRVVAKEMGRLPSDQRLKRFEEEAHTTLLRNSWFPAGLQAILVLFFPAL